MYKTVSDTRDARVLFNAYLEQNQEFLRTLMLSAFDQLNSAASNMNFDYSRIPDDPVHDDELLVVKPLSEEAMSQLSPRTVECLKLKRQPVIIEDVTPKPKTVEVEYVPIYHVQDTRTWAEQMEDESCDDSDYHSDDEPVKHVMNTIPSTVAFSTKDEDNDVSSIIDENDSRFYVDDLNFFTDSTNSTKLVQQYDCSFNFFYKKKPKKTLNAKFKEVSKMLKPDPVKHGDDTNDNSIRSLIAKNDRKSRQRFRLYQSMVLKNPHLYQDEIFKEVFKDGNKNMRRLKFLIDTERLYHKQFGIRYEFVSITEKIRFCYGDLYNILHYKPDFGKDLLTSKTDSLIQLILSVSPGVMEPMQT